MKLSNLWKEKEVTLSFEAFPPKKDSDFASVAIAVEKIAQLKPDFMSVTYGAGGSKVNQTTREIASIIENKYHIPAMAHLTCITATRGEVTELLYDLMEGKPVGTRFEGRKSV